MAEMWYYTCEGKQMDPVTLKEMKRLVGDGSLKPTDMVWKEGMPRWIRASSLKELFPDPTSALDQYFSSPKEVPKVLGTPPPIQTASAKIESAPQEEPQPKKRPRPASNEGEEESGRPPRRRAEAGGGGSSFGIIIAFVILAVVLLAAVGGGVLILVLSSKPSEQKPLAKAVDKVKAEPGDKLVKPPDVKEDPLPPGVLEGKGVVDSKSIFPNRDFVLKFRVKPGYQASVSATPVGAKADPDLNIYVSKDNDPTNTAIVTDEGPEATARVTFSLPAQEIVRVRIHNAGKKGATKISVIYNVSP